MDRTQMAGMLEHLIATLYDGAPVPPAEGGRFFHTVCDERRRKGDMFWTERRIHTLARELGYWPWTVNQIQAALSNRVVESRIVGP
jgi:hypothetical protein